MSTALTVISMALMLPICTLVGVFVGHKLTIKSKENSDRTDFTRR